MGQTNAQYTINAYPVVMKPLDFIMVFAIIALFGFLSTWIPVKRIMKSAFSDNKSEGRLKR
jgi:ABC-type lipoprotein release transport system permease subunit